MNHLVNGFASFINPNWNIRMRPEQAQPCLDHCPLDRAMFGGFDGVVLNTRVFPKTT
jgi:hypothetical protein